MEGTVDNAGPELAKITANLTRPGSFVLPFPKSFSPGTKVVIEGTPYTEHPSSFVLDFECGEGGDKALHVRPWINAKVLILNSQDHVAGWGAEVKNETLQLEPGVDFKLEVECENAGFKVLIDGKLMTYFHHRYPPQKITQVHVYRDVIIKEILYTKSLSHDVVDCIEGIVDN